MNKRHFAHLFSYAFHPMIISLLAFWILIYFPSEKSLNAELIFSICFVFSILIPIITVLILRKKGLLTDIDASEKDQRILPLTLGILYSGMGFSILYFLNADMIVQGLMFCFMINTLVTMCITRFWKISIHAIGVTGPAAALWIQGFQFPILMAALIICVGISRIILKAHTPVQVFAGAVLGFTLTYTQLKLFFI